MTLQTRYTFAKYVIGLLCLSLVLVFPLVWGNRLGSFDGIARQTAQGSRMPTPKLAFRDFGPTPTPIPTNAQRFAKAHVAGNRGLGRAMAGGRCCGARRPVRGMQSSQEGPRLWGVWDKKHVRSSVARATLRLKTSSFYLPCQAE